MVGGDEEVGKHLVDTHNIQPGEIVTGFDSAVVLSTTSEEGCDLQGCRNTRDNQAGVWNRKKHVPFRHSKIIQLQFNLYGESPFRHRSSPTLYPLILPRVTSDTTKNIPLDSH